MTLVLFTNFKPSLFFKPELIPRAFFIMKKLISTILNIFYPPLCRLCRNHRIGLDQLLCENCLGKLYPVPTPTCGHCGGGNDGILDICSECLDLNGEWQRGFSIWKYSSSAKELIHEFKYHGRTELSPFIVGNMYQVLQKSDCLNFDFVTFVPMHWLKKVSRGYNQSQLLANELALMLNIPCKKSVVRVKFARQQAMLNKQARLKNIKNVFKLKTKSFSFVENKHILVVDDVYTTGSTFKEMTRQLHRGRAASITIISIARG